MPEELNWRDQLPDAIKGEAALANFTDVGQMAQSFIDMKSYQGNSIHIPGEDAGDDAKAQFLDKLISKAPNLMVRPDFDNAEQSNEFYRTLGMPEKSEGYEFTAPEGVKIDDAKVGEFKDLAHGMGLTKAQFTKFITAITDADVESAKLSDDQQKASMEALNKEWGMATSERISQALSIAERTKAPDHVIEAIKAGNMPVEMVKWIHSLSVSIGDEGNNMGNNPASNNETMTPAEASEKILEIYANKEHPFHKGDKTAMETMVKLVGAANPQSSTNVNDLRSGGMFGP